MVKVSMEKLGGNIRRMREERGWSIEQLAEMSGETVDFVKKAEAGQRRISLHSAMAFCDTFGVSPNDLFRGIAESK